jgi:mRNA-degrading endonuclease RelE of RelBE toxin-antitoxin system
MSASRDSKALEGELTGFYRLGVGGYRIIYSHQPGPAIYLEYADLREFIYERFHRLLKERSDEQT